MNTHAPIVAKRYSYFDYVINAFTVTRRRIYTVWTPDHPSLIQRHRGSKSLNPFLKVMFPVFFELCLNSWKVMKISMVFYTVMHLPINPSMQVIMNVQCYHLALPLIFNSQQACLHVLLFCLLKIWKGCEIPCSNIINYLHLLKRTLNWQNSLSYFSERSDRKWG